MGDVCRLLGGLFIFEIGARGGANDDDDHVTHLSVTRDFWDWKLEKILLLSPTAPSWKSVPTSLPSSYSMMQSISLALDYR